MPRRRARSLRSGGEGAAKGTGVRGGAARPDRNAAKAFLASLPREVRGLASALREVVRGTVPQAEESLLWGSLSYHRPGIGGRVKGAVCLIVVKGSRVRLDFIHGIRLADPSGLLRGRQASKRSVPIETVADARRPEIADLIREAAGLDPTRWGERDGPRSGA